MPPPTTSLNSQPVVFTLSMIFLLVVCMSPDSFVADASGGEGPKREAYDERLSSTSRQPEQIGLPDLTVAPGSLPSAIGVLGIGQTVPASQGQHTTAYSSTKLVEAYPGNLDNKIPVILIHGVHGNRRPGSSDDTVSNPYAHYFSNLIVYLNQKGAAYNGAYKTYKFHYVSDRFKAADIARALQERIDEKPEFQNKEIILIAHSMGGLVARHYLSIELGNGRRLGDRVRRLITLATPHHGSQLANGAARAGLFQNKLTVRAALGLLDAAYWWKLNNCPACAANPQSPNRGTLLWDNFDGKWSGNKAYMQNSSEWNMDLPPSHYFGHKIIAYYGRISYSGPAWDTAKSLIYKPKNINQVGDFLKADTGAAFVALLLQGINNANLTNFNIFPQNDGLVPIESGGFNSRQGQPDLVKRRTFCPNYNHRQIKDGLLDLCDTGKNLFNSIFSDITSSASGPISNAALTSNLEDVSGLLVGPEQSLYGYETFGGSSSGTSERDHEIKLLNLGNTPVQVTSLSLGGSNPDQFSILNRPALPLTVPASGSVSVMVRFAPSSTGSKTATLNAINDSPNGTVSVFLSGFGMPASCDITLTPEDRYFPVTGGSGSFTVPDISCPWSISTNDEWIHPITIGNTINFTVDNNPTGAVRLGQIRVFVFDRPYSFDIAQGGSSSGCPLSLSASYQELPAGGGSGSFFVTTPDTCGWGFQSGSPMITVLNQGVRVGSGRVDFTVTPNSAPSIRYGTIIVEGTDTTELFGVAQPAGASACSLMLSTSEQIFPAVGGSNSFTLTTGSNCQWRVSSPDRWLSITSTNNGSGSRTISYSAVSNAGNSITRYGSVVVESNGQTAVLSVTQAGTPPAAPDINLPVTNANAGDALVNTSIYQSFVIQNTGPGYLNISSIYRSEGSAEFEILPYNNFLLSGGSTGVTVRFSPTSTGAKSATFAVSSSDPDEPVVTFTVNGAGVTQLTGGIDFVWANKSTAPERREFSAVAVVANNIYVLGGGAFKRNYKYDPTSNTWTQIADAPFGTDEGGAAVINGKIYIIGEPFENRIQIYDPNTGGWSIGSKIPNPRRGAVVTTVNGKLYVVGGGDASLRPSAIVEEYDPSTDTWVRKADMPTPRSFAAGATVNNQIYVIGGLGDGTYLSKNEAYDPVTNTWTIKDDMPSRRALVATVVLNNKIYVISGDGASGNENGTLPLVEEYDPLKSSARWATRNPLITARRGSVAGVVNNKVYVIGGSNNAGDVLSVEEGTLSASPRINLPVTSFACGDVPLGTICEKRIEVQNIGNALLTIPSYNRMSGGSDFQFFRNSQNIPPGQSVTFVERFVPTTTGSQTATYRITSNDPSTATVTFTLTGNGTVTPVQSGMWQVVRTIPLPGSAFARFIAVSNGKAYVTREGGGGDQSITTVDLKTGEVSGSIQINAFSGSSPGDIAVVGNRAYVPLRNLGLDGRLAVVNTDNNSVVTYVPVGADPWGVAASGTSVYVSNLIHWSNGDPATVKVLDRGSNTVTSTINVGRGASLMALDQTTSRLYVANGCFSGCSENSLSDPAKSVSVIDTTSSSVIATVPLPYNPVSVAVTSSRAYVCTGATVEVIDLSSNSIVASIPIPDTSYSIAATPEYVFVSSSRNKLSIIKAETNSVVSTINMASPFGIAVDPATNLVYVVNGDSHTVSVLQFIAPSFTVTTSSQTLAASPGGNTAFTSTVSSIDGWTGLVSLSCEGLPSGATCQFAQNPVTLQTGGSASTALTINVPPATVPGAYSFKVVGTGSNASNSEVALRSINSSSTNSAEQDDFTNLALMVPTCVFSLSPENASLSSQPTTGTVSVEGTGGCGWTAASNVPWITITSGESASGNGTVSYSVGANQAAESRTGTLTVAGLLFTVTQAGIGSDFRLDSVSPPAGRTAGEQQVKLQGAFSGLSTVKIGGTSVPWNFTNGTNEVTFTTPSHDGGAVSIELVSTSGSTYTKSNAFAYLPTVFTDNVLVEGIITTKAVHVLELRQAVDALRAVAGLAPAPWADGSLSPTGSVIRAVHITDLRTYLNDAAARLGYPTAAYTDPALSNGFMIKRLHIEELRQRIRAIAGLL